MFHKMLKCGQLPDCQEKALEDSNKSKSDKCTLVETDKLVILNWFKKSEEVKDFWFTIWNESNFENSLSWLSFSTTTSMLLTNEIWNKRMCQSKRVPY